MHLVYIMKKQRQKSVAYKSCINNPIVSDALKCGSPIYESIKMNFENFSFKWATLKRWEKLLKMFFFLISWKNFTFVK